MLEKSDLVSKLQLFVSGERLFNTDDSLLVAVSGGIDSLVLLDIIRGLHSNLGVAHCNFRLRGKESDGDEIFVNDFCKSRQIKLHSTSFQTKEYAEEKGISVQMAARDLRYEWMEKIRSEYSYDYIAVGHNRNDSIETFFINLSRGTGLKGLTGIKAKSGKVIRPLLFADRSEIEFYARDKGLKHREDSSNAQLKYKRNRIRHNIVPSFEELNPSFVDSMVDTIARLAMANDIYSDAVANLKDDLVVREKENSHSILIESLLSAQPLNAVVFEVFREFGFGRLQTDQIIKLCMAETGKQLFSESHVLTKDRDHIIIIKKEPETESEICFSDLNGILNSDFFTEAGVFNAAEIDVSGDPSCAYFDADLLQYPLRIRYWKEGDSFIPFGMKGTKKISDFLTDIKISAANKKHTRILESQGSILWVIGFRTDERYKITKKTNSVLRLKI